MTAHLKLAASITDDADRDFEDAALRRRFLALLQGPVRHRELSAKLAARMLGCAPDALEAALDDMFDRGKLHVRFHNDGEGRYALYSLPGTDLPKLPKVKGGFGIRKTGERSVVVPRRPKPRRAFAREPVRWAERMDAVMTLVAARERVCASDVANHVGCSGSNAWQLLVTLEDDGKLVSGPEKSAGGAVCRYYRLASAAKEQSR